MNIYLILTFQFNIIMRFIYILALFFFLLAASCSNNHTIKAISPPPPASHVVPLFISSPAFRNNDTLPALFTCEGANISPPLIWNNPFNKTRSFTIIMDDPDAPNGTWVHWIIYNIPSNDTFFHPNFPHDSLLPSGCKQGTTSFMNTGYGGPCPPNGVHHYLFKLYAVDTLLNLPPSVKKPALLDAMKGHILGEAVLTGKYERKAR